jgi:hypothetical protein
MSTLRSGQARLTFKQIGEGLGCSEKSARRWAKTAAGETGGTEPHAVFQQKLVELASTHVGGGKLHAV